MKIDKLNGVEEEINFFRKFSYEWKRKDEWKYNLYAYFSRIRNEEKNLNEST